MAPVDTDGQESKCLKLSTTKMFLKKFYCTWKFFNFVSVVCTIETIAFENIILVGFFLLIKCCQILTLLKIEIYIKIICILKKAHLKLKTFF